MLYIVTMLSAVQRMLARFLRPVWLKHNVQKRWLKQRKLAPKQSGQELVLVKYRQQLREYVLHQP